MNILFITFSMILLILFHSYSPTASGQDITFSNYKDPWTAFFPKFDVHQIANSTEIIDHLPPNLKEDAKKGIFVGIRFSKTTLLPGNPSVPLTVQGIVMVRFPDPSSAQKFKVKYETGKYTLHLEHSDAVETLVFNGDVYQIVPSDRIQILEDKNPIPVQDWSHKLSLLNSDGLDRILSGTQMRDARHIGQRDKGSAILVQDLSTFNRNDQAGTLSAKELVL